MKYEIFYNNQFIDVTSDTLSKTFEFQDRIDEVFASGSVLIKTDKISKNIPPYSIFKTTDDNSRVTYYLCSSEGTNYLTNDKWVHNCSLLEPTAICECFIIGTKTFSTTGTNVYDYQKIDILKVLVYQKYGYTLVYSNLASVFSDKHTFPFGAGSTLFSILTEIATKYNRRPRVTKIIDKLIYLEFINLENESEFSIENERILNIRFLQNGDSYCKFLETESSNVVDRNTISVAKGLTVRCEDIEISFESGKIMLPTRIESIKSLSIGAKTEISFIDIEGIYLESHRNGYSAETGWTYSGLPEESMCLEDWFYEIKRDETSILESPIYKLYQTILNQFDEERLRYTWKWKLVCTNQLYTNSDGHLDWKFNLEWDSSNENTTIPKDITSIVLEKSQYDLLETKDKPRYCYYTTGGDSIEGLGVIYKSDLWNYILGNTTNSCLSYVGELTNESKRYLDESSGVNMLIQIGVGDPDPRFNIFDVEYYGITNPIMIDSKEVIDENETTFKNFTRTYDISANMIDFDLLTSSMKKVNEMQGRVEGYIEYDIAGITHPYASQKIIMDGFTYYITAIVFKHTFARDYAELYLSKSYHKVAEAIGVKTQFNATKNPLDAIVERPIFFRSNEEVEVQSDAFVRIKTFNANATAITTLYKRLTVMKSSECVCCYTEALDQYAFDYISKKADPISRYFMSELVSYVDSNNEVYSIEAAIVKLPEHLSMEESRQLPLYDGEVEELIVLPKQIVYKDARERLTFTIYLPNATLV